MDINGLNCTTAANDDPASKLDATLAKAEALAARFDAKFGVRVDGGTGSGPQKGVSPVDIIRKANAFREKSKNARALMLGMGKADDLCGARVDGKGLYREERKAKEREREGDDDERGDADNRSNMKHHVEKLPNGKYVVVGSDGKKYSSETDNKMRAETWCKSADLADRVRGDGVGPYSNDKDNQAAAKRERAQWEAEEKRREATRQKEEARYKK